MKAPPSPAAHLTPDEALDLVHGLVAAERLAARLEHVRACPECEALLRECSDARESARARAHEALAGRAAPRPRAAHAWAALVAAAVLVLVAVVFLAQPGPGALARQVRSLPEAPEPIVHRDAAAGFDDARLRRGLEAYRAGRWASAAGEFGRAEATGARETFRRVYWANALARSGRLRDAARALEGVGDAQLPEPWRGETVWLRCLISFDAGDATRGDSLLGAYLAERPGEAARARALRGALGRAGAPAP